MIVDCIMASYELDALTVRDRELAGVVDLRVIVQGTTTFRGEPLEPLPDLDWHTETIVRRVTLPDAGPWACEHELRETSLASGETASDCAWLILADADEIPHPDAIRAAVSERIPSVLPNDYREWWMDWRAPDAWQPKNQPLIGRWADYAAAGGAQAARVARAWPEQTSRGWHLSTLGDAALAARKVSSFAHSEYDTPEYNQPAKFAQHRANRRDLLDRFDLELTDDLPGCAGEFPHLLSPGVRLAS